MKTFKGFEMLQNFEARTRDSNISAEAFIPNVPALTGNNWLGRSRVMTPQIPTFDDILPGNTGRWDGNWR
jgi:hypothetical protein